MRPPRRLRCDGGQCTDGYNSKEELSEVAAAAAALGLPERPVGLMADDNVVGAFEGAEEGAPTCNTIQYKRDRAVSA